MKPKKISYKIEEPCHADWDRMQPEAQGRFCSSCSKTVVDFSSMSDFSIVNYLEENRHQSVCGRFTEDQLDKTYLWTKTHPSAFHFDLKAVALGLALSTFSALPSHAQNVTHIEQHDTAVVERTSVKQGEVALVFDHRDESFVSGKIKWDGTAGKVQIWLIDANSNPLTFVEAKQNGTFKIPLDWSKNPAAVRITAPGYSVQTLSFESYESLKDLKITLYNRPMIKGKVLRRD